MSVACGAATGAAAAGGRVRIRRRLSSGARGGPGRHIAAVRLGVATIIDSGVEGTPTFYINGVRYEDSWDLGTFSATVKRYLSTGV